MAKKKVVKQVVAPAVTDKVYSERYSCWLTKETSVWSEKHNSWINLRAEEQLKNNKKFNK